MSDDKKKFSKLVLEERYNQELEMKVQEFLSDKVIVDESEYAALKRENEALGTALYHAMYEFEYHKDDPRWINIDVDDERGVAFDASLR